MSITSSLYVAESALNALDVAMNVTGHNIANVNTVGFKASEAEFADLFAAAQEQLQTGQGTLTAGIERRETQGATEVTGKALDLAVAGQGFFILKDANGGLFYSRAGEFTLDAGGNVVNPGGLALQGAAGNIVIPGGVVRLTIDAQGAVTGEFPDGTTQPLGQILLADFHNPGGLEAAGDSLLAATQESGVAASGFPGQGGLGVLLSGALEQSNVDLAQEFVNMILTQRGFQMNSRVITVADQMYSIAAGLKP